MKAKPEDAMQKAKTLYPGNRLESMRIRHFNPKIAVWIMITGRLNLALACMFLKS